FFIVSYEQKEIFPMGRLSLASSRNVCRRYFNSTLPCLTEEMSEKERQAFKDVATNFRKSLDMGTVVKALMDMVATVSIFFAFFFYEPIFLKVPRWPVASFLFKCMEIE